MIVVAVCSEMFWDKDGKVGNPNGLPMQLDDVPKTSQ